jgi:hypothetical protein
MAAKTGIFCRVSRSTKCGRLQNDVEAALLAIEGWRCGGMHSYDQVLSAKELEQLIEYLKSL